MNERFRELAEQASIDCELLTRWLRPNAYIWTATDDELAKFAQLIVAECALLCVSRPGPGDDVRSREHCAELITKHFGVGE